MMITTRKASLPFGLFLALSLAVFGQGPGGPGQDRDRVRQNLSTLRLIRLTQALSLTDDQAAKIYPTYTRIEGEKLKIQREMAQEIRSLRQLLGEAAPQDADILAELKNIQDARQAVKAKDDELESFLEKNLTTVQKAKYVFFQIEFIGRWSSPWNAGG